MSTTVPFHTLRPELALRRRDQVSSKAPFDNSVPFDATRSASADPYGHTELQVAWDKLFRARSLLEAEQVHMRDDRISVQAEIEALQRREEAVAARELRIQQIELQATLDQQEAQEAKESRSAIAKITQAPFDLARSVFGSKK